MYNNDIYNEYDDCDFEYYYPFTFNNREKGYLNSNIKRIVEVALLDTDTIIVPLNCYILIGNNDLVYSQSGITPRKSTKAPLSARAYNIYDCRSWQCTSITREQVDTEITYEYIWKEDEKFKYYDTERNPIYMPDNFYNGKVVKFSFFNFRYEQLYELELPASKEVELKIDEDLINACLNRKGSYFCKVTLLGDDEVKTVMLPNDFCIVVR